jgi:hypothetical protein
MRKLVVTVLFCAAIALADTTEIAFFRGVLSPANEVPAVNFPGGGSATIIAYITRDTSGKIISGSVDFNVGVFLGAPASLSGLWEWVARLPLRPDSRWCPNRVMRCLPIRQPWTP